LLGRRGKPFLSPKLLEHRGGAGCQWHPALHPQPRALLCCVPPDSRVAVHVRILEVRGPSAPAAVAASALPEPPRRQLRHSGAAAAGPAPPVAVATRSRGSGTAAAPAPAHAPAAAAAGAGAPGAGLAFTMPATSVLGFPPVSHVLVRDVGDGDGAAPLLLSLVSTAPFSRGRITKALSVPAPLPSLLPEAARHARKLQSWIAKTPMVACVALYREGTGSVAMAVEALYEL
jgi:hypothetical protein